MARDEDAAGGHGVSGTVGDEGEFSMERRIGRRGVSVMRGRADVDTSSSIAMSASGMGSASACQRARRFAAASRAAADGTRIPAFAASRGIDGMDIPGNATMLDAFAKPVDILGTTGGTSSPCELGRSPKGFSADALVKRAPAAGMGKLSAAGADVCMTDFAVWNNSGARNGVGRSASRFSS